MRKFIYGPGIDEPICMIDAAGAGETRYYYHYDGLGSVIALSNTSGTIVEGYIYDAFGACTVITSGGTDGNWLTDDGTSDTKSAYGNPYQFTARRWDDEIELYYYRARMYSPELGRFLQTDPIGYDDGMNMYTYCGNDPLTYVDPYGLCSDERREELQSYIDLAYRNVLLDIQRLRRLHAKIGYTHHYYLKVHAANAYASVGISAFAVAKIAGGFHQIRSATGSLATPLQQITYGPGLDYTLYNAGRAAVLKGTGQIITSLLLQYGVLVPMTKLLPAISDIETSLQKARQKLVGGYTEQAEQILTNIETYAQGIRIAREELRKLQYEN